MTVNPPAETVERLELLAKLRGMPLANAIQHSIRVNKSLADQQARHKRVVPERPEGMFERVDLGG